MSRFLASIAFVIASLSLAATASAEKRVALVIGNSAYVNSMPLANPVNDAADMAAALTEVGFTVVHGLDVDKRGFDGKVRDFTRALDSADVAVFFYAGHGLQVSSRNYLIPVDASLQGERDLDFEAVSVDFILKQMELGREGKTNVVFLDACRDNPLSRNLARSMGTRSASIGQGLAQVQTGVGTFIAYSTQPGNVALDGQGRNSPFTSALTKGIKQPGRNLTSVMIDVRKDVLTTTNGKQVPWDHSALTGEFYFHLAAAPGALPKGATADTDVQKRLRELEEELKKKSSPQQTANMVALAQATRAAPPARGSKQAGPEAHLRQAVRDEPVAGGDTRQRIHGDRRHPDADGAPRPGAAPAPGADHQARGGSRPDAGCWCRCKVASAARPTIDVMPAPRVPVRALAEKGRHPCTSRSSSIIGRCTGSRPSPG